MVRERVLGSAMQAGLRPRPHEAALGQRRQLRWRRRVERRERRGPEHRADHTRLLQRQPLRAGQAVEPRLQHAGERRRYRVGLQPRSVELPAVGAGAQRALVDQHLHQLFHVERIAFGARDQQRLQLVRHARQPLQQFGRELHARLGVERLQLDAPARPGLTPAGPAFEECRPGEPDHEHRQPVRLARDEVEQVERSVVGPVQVVEREQQRRAARRGERAERSRHRVERARAQLRRVVQDAGNMPARRKVETEQVSDDVRMRLGEVGAVGALEQRHDALLDLAARQRRRVAVVDREPGGEHVAQQAEGLALGLWVGTRAHALAGFGAPADPALELGQQPALAEAGLADDEHPLMPPGAVQPPPGLPQRLQLGLAADEPGVQPLHTTRPGAVGTRQCAPHEPGDDRPVDPLDEDRVLCLQLEGAPHLAVGVLADAQAARRRRLLHACGHVDREPAYRSFADDPAAEQHRAGVHAHPHVEAGVSVRRQHLDTGGPTLGEKRQSAQHRALGIVLECAPGPEHGQQAVAGVLQHAPAMAAHDHRTAHQEPVNDLVHLLRADALA